MRNLLRRSIPLTVTATFVIALSACGSNAGGATTCGDYKDLSSKDRTAVVQKFLEDEGKSNASGLTVNMTKASVIAYCSTIGSADDPISNVNG